MGLIFCQQRFWKVIWGLNVRQWWHDGSLYYCKNGALLLLSGSGSFSANSGSSEAACVCRASQMDSDRQFRSSAHYSNKTAEQRNPLLALCNPPQSHQIISAERYMTNTQEGWRKRKEDRQRHRGMKELNNRALGSCDLYISWHGHLVRHASRRRTLGLAQHPPAPPPTCTPECALDGILDQRAQCGEGTKNFPESCFMWSFKISVSCPLLQETEPLLK